jgi:hypothetical protein
MMLMKMPAEDIGNLSFGLNERQGHCGCMRACRWSPIPFTSYAGAGHARLLAADRTDSP